MAENDRPATEEEIEAILLAAKQMEANLEDLLSDAELEPARDLESIRARVGDFIAELRSGREIQCEKAVGTLAHLDSLMREVQTEKPTRSDVKSDEDDATLYCSFCGKSQHEVKKLIAAPEVFICDECVELCMGIIREEDPQRPLPGQGLRFSPRQRKPAMRALDKIAQFIDRHDPAGEAKITLETQTVLRMVVRTPDGKAEEVSGILETVLTSPDGLNLEPRPLEE